MSDTTSPQSQSFAAHVGYVLSQNPITMIAFGMLAFLVFCALFGPALVPYDPLASSDKILQPPSSAHWFGTDHWGRDVFSRVIVATRLDMAISIGAVALSFVAGAIPGCAAGYLGGWGGGHLRPGRDLVLGFSPFFLSDRESGGVGKRGDPGGGRLI